MTADEKSEIAYAQSADQPALDFLYLPLARVHSAARQMAPRERSRLVRRLRSLSIMVADTFAAVALATESETDANL